MIRKFLLTASAVALGAASLGLAAASTATAAITVTAGHGSSLQCDITATVKVKPSLEDDYIKADHASDPNPDVVALNNTPFAPPAPETVAGKGGSVAGTCSGTITDGTNNTNVSKIALTLTADIAGGHGSSTTGSCSGFARQGLGLDPPSTARYIEIVKYTATPFKVAPTTITDSHLNVPAAGLDLVGGTISGSFAGSGGTSETLGYVDATTTTVFGDEVTGPAPDGTTVAASNVNNGAAPNVCQPGLKIKVGKKHSATIVKPKGLKAIGVVQIFGGSLHSQFTASR